MITVIARDVIIVITRDKKLHNSQSRYKISMAVSDLIVAIFVIPSIINNTWQYAYHSKQSVMVNEKQKLKFSFSLNTNSTAYAKTFTIFIYSTGFITVYSLVFAAIDRLLVVVYPFFYRSYNMTKVSKYVCVVIWISSFLS